MAISEARKRRNYNYWLSVKHAYQWFGVLGVIRTMWHNIWSPALGCSCTFCFYSFRRRFPPGHPDHYVQREARRRTRDAKS